MKNMLDFDCFLREAREEMLEVRVYGETCLVRPSIPALVPVMMARAERMDDAEAAMLMLRAADALFGKAQVDRMCEHGMSTEELAELVQRTFRLIQGEEPEEAEEAMDDDKRRRRSGKK